MLGVAGAVPGTTGGGAVARLAGVIVALEGLALPSVGDAVTAAPELESADVVWRRLVCV
jgi:hypothetical protein